MQHGGARLAFVLLITLNCFIWSRSRYAAISPADVKPLPLKLLARFSDGSPRLSTIKECHPFELPLEQQCAHTWKVCPKSETFFGIPYLQGYFCSKTTTRPVIFAGLTIWLIFLFSTLGISASDFFCPNLATISSFLGLDESVAGVTFLAFGNGSPDLFSTFSAFKAGSGSLAVGELLGAASFIVSVVVGSMCIIKPFRVEKYQFLRDVGFFTCAVALLLTITHDGRIRPWEAIGLVCVYFGYVAVVVVGSWWERRREIIRAREALIGQEYTDEGVQEPYHDEEATNDQYSMSLSLPAQIRTRALSESLPSPSARQNTDDVGPAHHEAEFTSKHGRIAQLPSFSLLGALEFRQVITSLQHDSSANALAAFETFSPYAGGHYHFHGQPSRPHSPVPFPGDGEEVNVFDQALSVPLNDRRDSLSIRAKAPSIIVTTPGEGSTISLPQEDRPPSTWKRIKRTFRKIFYTLFPTLHGFKSKSWAGMIVSVFAAPAVLALTLTLPVVLSELNEQDLPEDKSHVGERLIDFEEEGIERALTAEAADQIEQLDIGWNKWLMVAQCALGPVFCAAVLFGHSIHFKLIMAATAAGGLVAALLVAIFADFGNDKAGRIIRAFMGFAVAIVWIMAIADEVVDVLQTFGFIFGLSDAIIGLTIFAVGNSMADLIADISVAAFAPIMGFAACFGGPMLNILLGIGGSGIYITRQTGEDVLFHFSTTLLVSAFGLLVLLVATLIFVPYNNYWLSRRWGIFLILSYVIIMTVNVVVEIRHA